MPNVIQQAADLLKQAKRVLFLTSAGMSADSNSEIKMVTGKTSPHLKKKIFRLKIWLVLGHFVMNSHMHGRFMNGGDEMLMTTPLMKDTKSSTIGWRIL
jgi:hypothetical protein